MDRAKCWLSLLLCLGLLLFYSAPAAAAGKGKGKPGKVKKGHAHKAKQGQEKDKNKDKRKGKADDADEDDDQGKPEDAGKGKGKDKDHEKGKGKDKDHEKGKAGAVQRPPGWAKGRKKGWRDEYPPGWSKWDKKKQERWKRDLAEAKELVGLHAEAKGLKKEEKAKLLEVVERAARKGKDIKSLCGKTAKAIKKGKRAADIMKDLGLDIEVK